MPLPRLAFALADDSGQSTPNTALASGTSLTHLEERALVQEAQAGSRLAFEELVRRYDRDVLRLALNLMKRTEDARDVYQEAFLKVYRNLHRFRFECSFYTWLYRIVTNVCLDHLRRRQARPEDQAPELHPTHYEEGIADFFERQKEQRPSADPERHLIGVRPGCRTQRVHTSSLSAPCGHRVYAPRLPRTRARFMPGPQASRRQDAPWKLQDNGGQRLWS